MTLISVQSKVAPLLKQHAMMTYGEWKNIAGYYTDFVWRKDCYSA